jgi:PPOX class probable F420-dependent enzyme
VDEVEARRRFAAGPVAHLATVTPDGAPHVVPVTFVLDGTAVWWAVDEKPKRSRALARLANIAAEPRVSVLVDHYTGDWGALWWVRADGLAEVVGSMEASRAIALLAARYPAYRPTPPQGPVVRVEVQRWRWWSAS